MAIDLQHLAASTRKKVEEVVELYRKADEAAAKLDEVGVAVVMRGTGKARHIRTVELFDPEGTVTIQHPGEPPILDDEVSLIEKANELEFGSGFDIGGENGRD